MIAGSGIEISSNVIYRTVSVDYSFPLHTQLMQPRERVVNKEWIRPISFDIFLVPEANRTFWQES